MEWNTFTDPWLWLIAAVVFIVLFGLLLAYNARRSKLREAMRARQDGWTPTGRIDFAGPTDADPNATGNFFLQAEDTRIVGSIGGLDHREIRWRKATLNEAKKVVMAYHAQGNLATSTALVVNASNDDATKSGSGNERKEAFVDIGAPADEKTQG